MEKASKCIDLIEDDSKGCCKVGTFQNGAIKRIQSSNAPIDLKALNFEDILQTEGLQRCLLTSYVIDDEWLFPMLMKCPNVIVVLDNGRTRQGCFLHPYHPNIRIVFPPLIKFPTYGVMHAKVMLLFYEQWLRVVVSSANLVPYDYDKVQNIVFIQDLPKSADFHAAISCDFRRNLEVLLEKFNVQQLFVEGPAMEHYDWSRVKAKLILSLPGMTSPKAQPSVGLVALSQAIKDLLLLSEGEALVECQGSSLGAMDAEWLRDVLTCCLGDLPEPLINPQSALGKRTLPKRGTYKSKKANDDTDETNLEKERLPIKQRFKVIFPTMRYARDSPDGPAAFGTIFFQQKNWQSPKFPKGLLHRCESSYGVGQPLHSKIMALSLDSTIQWYYLGSANFTQSAWGTFVKGKTRFLLANYEAGILVPANLAQEICDDGIFPFPYKRPPLPYTKDDHPWMQDSN